MVRWRTSSARARWVTRLPCCSTVFTGANRIVGRCTASQIASVRGDNQGFFRIFGAGTTFFRVSLCPVGSSGCQQSAPEEWIGGAPVHLGLDRLEAVDLAFDRARTPGLGDCRSDSLNVTADACCKGGQLTARGVGDPLIEACIVVATYRRSKTAGEFARDRKLRRIFMEMVKEPLGLLIERCRGFAQ